MFWGRSTRGFSTIGILREIGLVALVCGGALILVGPHRSQAAEINSENTFVSDGQNVRRVVVTLNKSKTFRFQQPFTRAVVGAPDIADVLPISDRAIYVQAKKVGTTNVSIFDEMARVIGIIDVEVAPDTGTLQQKIQASTGSRGIRVSSSQGQIILSGTPADSVAAERAVTIAQSFVPAGGSVVNAMQVAPSQQVQLEVRFLEVSRQAGRELGVNWFGANAAGNRGFNTGPPGGPDSPVLQADRGPGGLPLFRTIGTLAGGAAPFGTFLANVFASSNGNTLDVMITALETKGLVRRLAEPNLMAMSGDAARFLAGGEFPVPVGITTQGGFPTTTIEFKKFGVELAFVPTVLSRGVINLRVEPSVSELDFTNAVTIGGTRIPALTRRDARTTVELRDGQSFAIAGLLQTRSERDVSQLPWIGSVPVIGALFRSASYLQNETDLVIVITPRLVAPAVPGQRLASPLESRLPSNDVDFFLHGQPEVRKRFYDYVAAGGELKGPYGHLIQPEVGRPAVVVTEPGAIAVRN